MWTDFQEWDKVPLHKKSQGSPLPPSAMWGHRQEAADCESESVLSPGP